MDTIRPHPHGAEDFPYGCSCAECGDVLVRAGELLPGKELWERRGRALPVQNDFIMDPEQQKRAVW